MLAAPEHKILFVHIHKNAGRAVQNYLRQVVPLALQKPLFPGFIGPSSLIKTCLDILGLGGRKHLPAGRLTHTREWMGQPVRGHESLFNLIDMYPEFKSYFKFAVVRNPWDRLVSAYYWIKGKPSGSKGFNATSLTHVPDFESFVQMLYNTYTSPGFQRKKNHPFHDPGILMKLRNRIIIYPSQVAYLLDRDGKMLADAVVHQEYLEGELIGMLAPILGMRAEKFPAFPSVGASRRPSDYTSQYNDRTMRMVEEMYAPDIKLFGYRFGQAATRLQEHLVQR